MERSSTRLLAAVGVAGLFVSSCGGSPDQITFTDDGSPAVTVAQTTTTIASVDTNVDFEKLQDAFRELNQNPPTRTTIDVYGDELDKLLYTYEVTYVPRSQWRYATVDHVGARPDLEVWMNLDGEMILSVESLLNQQLFSSNVEALQANGFPIDDQEPTAADLPASLRPEVQALTGYVQYTNYEILPSVFLASASPGPIVAGYVIENPIVADRGEIRVLGEVDGTAEFEVVPNANEPARYYVMRTDIEGRIVMVDSRLAGVNDKVVVWVNYDVVEGDTEPPEAMTTDELVATAGEPDTWTADAVTE